MKFAETHIFLVQGKDFAECRHKVQRFFAHNVLVKYDVVDIVEAESSPAQSPEFFPRVDAGMEKNRGMVAGVIGDLVGAGFTKIEDLLDMGQGYESKTLHILTHLLDGFFGIDSYFYNLAEDSNWLSAKLRGEIAKHREGYWLISAHTASENSADLLPQLRSQANQP